MGILPHFVPSAPVEIPPVPEPEAATICMPEWDADDEVYFANDMDCMLGDGGTTIVMTAMTSDGRSSEVTSVHRNPGGGADVEIAIDLWGNGSGHISGTTNPHLGWDLSVPSWYAPKPEPLNAHFVISLEADGSLGTGLAEAGISLERGGVVTVRDPVIVKAGPNADGKPATPMTAAQIAGTAARVAENFDYDVATTLLREDGYTKDTLLTRANPFGVPQCKQAVEERSTDDAGGTANFILWAAVDGGEVAIDVTDATPGNLPSAGDSLTALANWAAAFNAKTGTGYKDIKTVRVKDAGTDGILGDDPSTAAPADEGADDVDLLVPAVICETEDGDAEQRYTSGIISISPDTTYCNRNNNRSALVYVLAYLAEGRNSVTPMVDQESYPDNPTYWRHGLNASTALNVHCPLE